MFDKMGQKGFTFFEVIVALGIFASVITVAVGLFIQGTNNQRRISEIYYLQREGGFMIERVTKELRVTPDKNLVQAAGKKWEIEFTDPAGAPATIKYCLSDASGSCKPTGGGPFEYLARNGAVINSSEIVIDDIKFYYSDSIPANQYLVTITMKISKKNGALTNGLLLQDSVALRVY